MFLSIGEAIAVQQVGLLSLGQPFQAIVQLPARFLLFHNALWLHGVGVGYGFDAPQLFRSRQNIVQRNALVADTVLVLRYHPLFKSGKGIPYHVHHGVADGRGSMPCSFIKSARRMLDGAGRYSCAMKSALLFELFPHYNTLCRFVQYTVSSPPLLLQSSNQQGHFSFSVAVLPLFCPFCKIPRIFRQETKNTRVPTLGTLVQRITPPCSVAAGCAVLWTSNRLSAPARKKCIFHGRSSYNLYGLYLYASVRRIETN